MRPAGDHTYIAIIADREGWLFEHIVDAPSRAAAERELREVLRHWNMTLIEVRPAPIATDTPVTTAPHLHIAVGFVAVGFVSALARIVVL